MLRVRMSLDGISDLNSQIMASIQQFENKTTLTLENLSTAIISRTSQAQPNVSESNASEQQSPSSGRTVRIQATLQLPAWIGSMCKCNCHAPLAIKIPSWFAGAVGSLLIRYSMRSRQPCHDCRQKMCQGRMRNILRANYYFPTWLLHRMICFYFSYSPMDGQNVALRTPRMIAASSEVFSILQSGNISGVQNLFDHDLASSFDISFREGRSLLHV